MLDPVPGHKQIKISVIIPVYNAAYSLAETLDSLRSQTYPHWEAVIVDDGSSDGSNELVQHYAAQDGRYRYVRGDHAGVSAARNTGIAQARNDWLLFLDADDWIKAEYLEHMTGVLAANPGLDGVHCGWARVNPEGWAFDEHPGVGEGDLSGYFLATCYFTIHAVLVRTALVVSVGGFDTSLRTCEDWDLWLRVTTGGARFGVVPEILALYRTSPGTASFDALQLMRDGFTVLERAHKVKRKSDETGIPGVSLSEAELERLLVIRKYLFVCWCAGILIGNHLQARPLLDALPLHPPADLDPVEISSRIFSSALIPECRPADTGTDFWMGIAPYIHEFLIGLESQVQVNGLATQTMRQLWCSILKASAEILPGEYENITVVKIDILQPIPHLRFPLDAERVFCLCTTGGEKLGVVELPVFDGLVPNWILADAIAAGFAWEILKRFFQAAIYPGLMVVKMENGLAVWRGETRVAEGLPDEDHALNKYLFERSGWFLFLQEVWGQPQKPLDWFYNPLAEEAGIAQVHNEDSWLQVDVSEAFPDVECAGEQLQVAVSVGGAAAGVLSVPVQQGKVSAAAIRSQVTRACGFELCRVAVREGILGSSFDEPGSLHQRLGNARIRVVN